MHRTWSSTFCFVLCLVINYTPPLFCASLTTIEQQKQQQQQQQQKSGPHEPTANVVDAEAPAKNSRNKRELINPLENVDLNKRVRSFVGKRQWDGEFLDDPGDLKAAFEYRDVPVQAILDSLHENVYNGGMTKRVRSFVGKRDWPGALRDEDGWYLTNEEPVDLELNKRLRSFVGKRVRSFVGKRNDIDKRLRSFVGKRVRSFVGKRDGEYDFGNDLLFADKRVRHFVGKRPRKFVGKRVRSFVGKRGYEFDDPIIYRNLQDLLRENIDNNDDDIFFINPEDGTYAYTNNLDFLSDDLGPSAEKRLRSFVGKRGMDNLIETQKRLRSFVGKREDKRVRSFVGKRSDDDSDANSSLGVVSLPSKRLRSFVGKRSNRDTVDVLRDKRLRSFVGKRSPWDTAQVSRGQQLYPWPGSTARLNKRSTLDSAQVSHNQKLWHFVDKR